MMETQQEKPVSEPQENIKVCPHRYCGCISQNGYVCTHSGPCAPMDEHGNEFTVREWIEDGTRMTTRDYKPVAPVIDAEAGNAALAMVAQMRTHGGRPA